MESTSAAQPWSAMEESRNWVEMPHDLMENILGRLDAVEILNSAMDSSSKLKRLCLINCHAITSSRLSEAIERVPQLEELHLSDTCTKAYDIEVIGRNCPQLKSFKIVALSNGPYSRCDNQVVAIAKNMPGLRHLQIHSSTMTNNGVHAILNGCPHLESLDIHMRCIFDVDQNLLKMCMERIKDFKHSTE